MSVDQYHHSVWHYHSPLPLGHRNRPVFQSPKEYGQEPLYPQPTSGAAPPGRAGGRASERMYSFTDRGAPSLDASSTGRFPFVGSTSNPAEWDSSMLHPSEEAALAGNGGALRGSGAAGLVDSVNRARSASPSRRRAYSTHLNQVRNPLSLTREGLPVPVALRTEDLSDHFYGGSVASPSAYPGQNYSGQLQKPKAEERYNPLAHHSKPLTSDESNLAWLQGKNLLFGVHKRRAVPYVTPDEFYDPLRGTSATKRTTMGYGAAAIPKHLTKARSLGGSWIAKPLGSRRCPAHALEPSIKVNWHNPFDADAPTIKGPAPSLKRLPPTPLLEEVEERLRHQGCGSLLDVRMAPDESIARLLHSVGFGSNDVMVILWELRRRYPQSQSQPGPGGDSMALMSR